jgi:predicted ATPase
MLRSCVIENYRSVRRLELPLERVTVLLGANGTGKTNCYRALQMLHAAACGRLGEHFAEEGGMPSALWAGDHQKGVVRLTVAVELDEFGYRLACGLPTPRTYGQSPDMATPHMPKPSCFRFDPEVKDEDITATVAGARRPVPLCQRRAIGCTLRDEHGATEPTGDPLDLGESVLSQISDPRRYGELALVRDTLARWRFYHQFRTDRASPLRQPQISVRSPILASDGVNLAAALQTVNEFGGEERLERVVADAFPGHELLIDHDDRGRMAVAMSKPGIHRALTAAELSDGTLRFLCLAAALLSPRPPQLLALNEPETSLHPDLIPSLAALIVEAGTRGQVLVTTHSQALAEAVAAGAGVEPLRLSLAKGGETVLEHRMGLLRPVRKRRAD